jgi:hypothetical protein
VVVSNSGSHRRNRQVFIIRIGTRNCVSDRAAAGSLGYAVIDRSNSNSLSNTPVSAVKCCAVADSVRGIRLGADGDIRDEFPRSLRRDSTGLRDSAESIASRLSGQNPELRLSLRT